jgi:GAF domain-containing protein
MAIANAQLYQRAQASLEAERRAYGEMSREAWRELLRTRRDLAFLSNRLGVFPAGDMWEPRMEAAIRTGEPKHSDGASARQPAVAVPIKLRDQVIGVIDAQMPEGADEWTADQVTLLQALADQLGVALEGAQLYRDAQERAGREAVTRRISDEVLSAAGIDEILERTAQALSRELNASEVVIQLGAQTALVGDSLAKP